MRSYREYKNHSRRAKIIAWLMDIVVKPVCAALRSHPRREIPINRYVERVLLVRLDHMGDLLMATPAIRALKKRLPHVQIDLLGGEMASRIMRGNEDIDRTYTFNATWYDPRRGKELWPVDVVRTIFELRKNRYDAAVDMRGDFRVIVLFLWCIGARRRFGFSKLGLECLLTDSNEYDPERNSIDINFDSLSSFGVDRSDRTMRFFVSEEDEQYIAELLKQYGAAQEDFLIGMSPTTNRIEQRWSDERFARVADRLIDDFKVKVILVSAPADASIVELVRRGMKHPVLDLSGRTDLGQLGALLKRLRLFIANDSGPMHLSIALGTPTIGIFGSTSVQRSWPCEPGSTRFIPITSQVDCPRPCFGKDCEDKRCFDSITVDQVYEAARAILKAEPFFRED